MIILAFFLMACNAVVTPPSTPTSQPTQTPLARATRTVVSGGFLTPLPPTPTFTPSPTPTPVVHVVVQGDTLFGIALDYGVTVDALLLANGLDLDQFLRIGQALIIPLGEEEAADSGVAAPVGHMILPTPTPLPLEMTAATLYQTPVGGVWCLGEVVNTTAGPVTNMQVQVTLVSADGQPLMTGLTLAAADYLAPGKRAPFAILFKAPPAGFSDAQVRLLRGEAISQITAAFVPLDVARVEGAVSGPQYRVTGQLLNNSAVTLNRISVVVTLYDDESQVVGYRQKVYGAEEVIISAGQSWEFRLLLTPQGLEPPASFQVLAWGVD